MAFIPAKKFEIGDKVILSKDIESCSGTFEKGTEVYICDIGNRGYSIKDEFGNKIIECGWDICESI